MNTLVKLNVDAKGMHLAEELGKSTTTGVKKAAYDAIKRTTSKMRVQVSLHIRKSYTAQASIVRETITTKTPSLDNLTGKIISSGSPLLITAFKLSPNPKNQIRFLKGEINYKKVGLISTAGRTTRKRPKPMRVQIRKGGASGTVPGLFIQKSSRSNYAGPILRYVRARYPLRIPYGPSVPQMFGNENVLKRFVPEAAEFYKKRFLHEVEFQLRGLK